MAADRDRRVDVVQIQWLDGTLSFIADGLQKSRVLFSSMPPVIIKIELFRGKTRCLNLIQNSQPMFQFIVFGEQFADLDVMVGFVVVIVDCFDFLLERPHGIVLTNEPARQVRMHSLQHGNRGVLAYQAANVGYLILHGFVHLDYGAGTLGILWKSIEQESAGIWFT